ELPHLSDPDRKAREVIDVYISYREETGVNRPEAAAEFIRESAYSWANRLFTLRCLEARSLIDEVILQKEVYGNRSLIHHRFARKNPEACAGEDDGLFAVAYVDVDNLPGFSIGITQVRKLFNRLRRFVPPHADLVEALFQVSCMKLTRSVVPSFKQVANLKTYCFYDSLVLLLHQLISTS
ncbi:unnamed protein product, partial [marine sediment metagenome]